MIMELTYQQNGDYLIPNIKMDEQPQGTLNKYGRMRKQYLKEHKRATYSGLVLSNKLMSHLFEIQEQAEKRMELLIKQMMESEEVNEALKEQNQMLWVQKMNSIRSSAEEIVLTELIYS